MNKNEKQKEIDMMNEDREIWLSTRTWQKPKTKKGAKKNGKAS